LKQLLQSVIKLSFFLTQLAMTFSQALKPLISMAFVKQTDIRLFRLHSGSWASLTRAVSHFFMQIGSIRFWTSEVDRAPSGNFFLPLKESFEKKLF
jgi:hypothetical protein